MFLIAESIIVIYHTKGNSLTHSPLIISGWSQNTPYSFVIELLISHS